MNKLYSAIIILLLICCKINSSAQNLGGIDFWGTFPLNNTTINPIDQMVLISGCNTQGKITYPSPSPSVTNYTITAGVPTILNMPIKNNTTYETIQNNGFHVVCDSIIAAYLINYQPATVDGETLIPTPMLGTDYVISSYSDSRTPSFTIVATQNNTQVTITTKVATTGGHAANTPWTITLNAGQTYMVGSNAMGSGLTGSHVQSTQPVAVFAHTPCTGFICGACDMIMVELLPTNLWGKKYITTQSLKRNSMSASMADYVEITAGALGANVVVNNFAGNNNFSLAAYGTMKFCNPKNSDEGKADLVINSNNPVQVVQYSQGWGCDNSGTTDPESITIFPESMWISEGQFASSTTLTSASSGVDIVINDVGVPLPSTTLTLDGIPIPAIGWTSIGTSTYKAYRAVVPPGNHTVKSSSGYPFEIYMFAIGGAESYCVQGGTAYSNHVCSNVAVPISLISFTGEKSEQGTIGLRWNTALENNCDYFEIEKSKDGNTWNSISKCKSKGTANRGSFYEFTDRFPFTDSPNYYRLKEVEKSGKEIYSGIVSVTVPKSNSWIRITPNIISRGEKIKLEINPEIKGSLDLQIRNVEGRVIKSLELKADKTLEISTELNDLETGFYLLLIKNQQGEEFIQKIGIR